MGLSEQQCRVGKYFSVLRLNRLVDEWESDYRVQKDLHYYARIRTLVRQMWHALLQCHAYPSFMSTDGSITGEANSPWAIALVDRLEEHQKSKSRIDDFNAEFDAIDFTSIDYLMSRCDIWLGNIHRHVFRIYQETENLAQYFQGAEDKLAELVSAIQGECFGAFTDSEGYAKAYLLREIMKILYGNSYPYNNDFVASILVKHHIHHDIAELMPIELSEIIKHHVDLVGARILAQDKLKVNEGNYEDDEDFIKVRLNKLVAFAASKLTYRGESFIHIWNDIKADIEKSPFKDLIGELKVVWDESTKKAQALYEKEQIRYDLRQNHRELDCYGEYGYSMVRDIVQPRTFPTETTAKKTTAKKTTAKKTTAKKTTVKKTAAKKTTKKTTAKKTTKKKKRV